MAQQGSTLQPGVGPILSTAMRGLAAITDKLTDVALQFAPADASPGVVRVAVNAGLVLVALSFVKSILSVGGIGLSGVGGVVRVNRLGCDCRRGSDAGVPVICDKHSVDVDGWERVWLWL